jgi:hypothetical protein
MTFTVTYRAKDGAKAEVEVEAASRSECFAQCKARGIAPLGVREGRASSRPRAAGTAAPHAGGAGSGKIWRAAILAAAVLAVAGGLWLWLGRGEERPSPAKPPPAERPKAASRPETPPSKPRVAPAPASTNAPAPATNAPTARKAQETYIDERGIERYPGGMRVRRPAARTVKIEIDPLHRFKHTSEAQIAGLLQVKPGSLIVGDMKYSYRFVEDFIESLKEPIEILDTDSEYDKQLKLDVIETKKQLKAAMDRGEDIAQIMTDTRNELRRLGQYRDELKKELHKIRMEGEYTDQQIEDFTAAANKLLADKGCRPIKMPTLLMRYMREKKAQDQQNQ